MAHDSYLYNREGANRYTFISVGRHNIFKIVEFVPTTYKGLFNLSFGDLLPNGTLNDKANSNNGDLLKVLTTVVQIVLNYTAEFPDIKIVFTGSTMERTRLYARILSMYYGEFSKAFRISAFVKIAGFYKEVLFDLSDAFEYHAFFITRIY